MSHYQNPDSFSFKKQYEVERKRGVPGGGWDKDDTDRIVSNISNLKGFMFKPEISSKPIQFEKNTENTAKKDEKTVSGNKIEVETKLIEDIMNPSGINIKPADNLLKEFNKRAKTLNKEAINRILLNKLSNHENMTDGSELRILLKCLYLVESLLTNKIDEFYNFFRENNQIFSEIQNFHNSNKKLCDLTNIIQNLLNKDVPQIVKSEGSKTNNRITNLIEFNDEKSENSFSGLELGSSIKNEKKPKENIDFLEICGTNTTSTNKATQPKNEFKFLKKDDKKVEKIDLINVFDTKDESSSKSSFKFIKQTVQNDNSLKPLKNFDDLIENVIINSSSVDKRNDVHDLGIIDFTKNEILTSKSTSKKIDINIDNLFEEKYNTGKINNNNLIQVNADNLSIPLNMTTNPGLNQISNFDYDLVSKSINTQKKKDHFDFVNALLKKK